jgi:hypothetical protein
VGTAKKKWNCWEYWECGREPNGKNTSKLGVCPSAAAEGWHGTNSGKNGGRYCWKVTGTMSMGTVEGVVAKQIISCSQCPFFKIVLKEEGNSFK